MGSHHRTRIRNLLVISEIAFSLVLLTGAGLMIGTLKNLLGVSLGFNPENVITMRVSVLKLVILSQGPPPFTTSCRTVYEVCLESKQLQS